MIKEKKKKGKKQLRIQLIGDALILIFNFFKKEE